MDDVDTIEKYALNHADRALAHTQVLPLKAARSRRMKGEQPLSRAFF